MNYRSGTQAFMHGAHTASPLTTGVIPFGLIAGVTAVGMGMSPTTAMGMTLIFYSGSAQIAVLQMLQTGALPVTIVLTALVINLRFLMYSASLAPHLHHLPRRKTWLLSYLLADQVFALFSLRTASGGLGRFAFPYYMGAAVTMWVAWNLAVLAGVFLGARIPESWSLSFTIPLSFLALLIPGIRNVATLSAAVVGGALAVLAVDLPYNLGMLTASLGGVITGLLVEHLRKEMPAVQGNEAEQEAS
ncbi:branched-chain amino acid ABC transporter permease [Pseudomonas putida]|uniref:Branched-chain amino acid ABC transporter permease n=1 Tax=Pseudomonas putida TaxID=303 RepID=A0A2Z4REQ8_PSEPU|nr:AzlC family ABC transporter permease [Pseudomonas putida]AWY39620.1 branched-chain amino acid ABC transporter permease [Pseudomonas putida]